MAMVTRENIGKLHDKIVVKISKEDYIPSFEKALKNHGKNAQVPGFRKGHVPPGMIRKMYGQSVFVDEVLRTVNQELEGFLKKEQPQIFGQPVAMPTEQALQFDMAQPADFEFPFEIGLKPDFDITPLQTKKGGLTRNIVTADDKMLDEEIERLRISAAPVEDAETLEAKEDIAYIDYVAIDENGAEIPGTACQETITLENLPEKLQEQLIGKAIKTSITFIPSEEYNPDKLSEFITDVLKQDPEDEAVKNSPYRLTLSKIRHRTRMETDEHFFEKIFPGMEVRTEADFRAHLKEDLNKQLTHLGKDRLQNEIFEILVHETPIELPVDFLKTWLQKGEESTRTAEEVEQEYPGFEHQLRWTLISDKLIREYNLDVSYEEVTNELKARILSHLGMEPDNDVPWMDAYLERMMKEEKTVDETFRRLLFGKLFDKLEAELEVKEQEINYEDFTRLPEAHHH